MFLCLNDFIEYYILAEMREKGKVQNRETKQKNGVETIFLQIFKLYLI